MCVCIYVYTYIYIERERERERDFNLCKQKDKKHALEETNKRALCKTSFMQFYAVNILLMFVIAKKKKMGKNMQTKAGLEF